ncbi:MAG: glycosyltransferase family 9 protein [Planctomycetaceae bacterium]|jgi:ADP-heptose:LPS heptosyltransferase|nr:glycosyltransferase family 9 protein [Planctomycetaceae bacterium]
MKMPETPKRNIQRLRRILLVCFSDVVNIVHGLPVLSALRLRFPYAEIAWLTEESNALLLNRLFSLDRLLIVKSCSLRSFDGVFRLRKRLQDFAPDVTIDLQSRFKSAFAAWLSGAKIRIGFGGVEGRECSGWFNNHLVVPDAEHAVEQNIQLLQPLGIYGSSICFDLFECEIDRYCAQGILNRSGLHGNFAIICAGAGGDGNTNNNSNGNIESKFWHEKYYADLAAYLSEQWNLPSLVVWSNESEQKFAERISNITGGVAKLAPAIALNEYSAIARKATITVGADTAQLHIAAAVGTKCLGLCGNTNQKRNAPYGEKNYALQKTLNKNTQNKNQNQISDAIDTAAICNICDKMLNDILKPQKINNTQQKINAGKKVA